ncbi:hypothetical protein [Tenacibaculum ovolyticum]|uniref:hypothetical protein n=1 Tax=Tenacibaculum ovolyticum TaxID=104270 RepID=UPI001E54C440|nr:hypothetical protein [Tenacibaculum ovolyticum]
MKKAIVYPNSWFGLINFIITSKTIPSKTTKVIQLFCVVMRSIACNRICFYAFYLTQN